MINSLALENIYTGTSGLVLPMTKTSFPAEFQQQSRLSYYASLLNSIEINSTFYKLPRKATVASWAISTPADFRFTFKLPKIISHNKGLIFDEAHVYSFIEAISPAKGRNGCLLIQFPKSITFDQYNQLEKLLNTLALADRGKEWALAVEFRHPSWYERETSDLLEEYDATMVLHDVAGSAPDHHPGKSSTVYLRFHGPGTLYRGSYADDHLKKYASMIKTWSLQKKTIYAYFNNTIGDAFQNLLTLNAALITR